VSPSGGRVCRLEGRGDVDHNRDGHATGEPLLQFESRVDGDLHVNRSGDEAVGGDVHSGIDREAHVVLRHHSGVAGAVLRVFADGENLAKLRADRFGHGGGFFLGDLECLQAGVGPDLVDGGGGVAEAHLHFGAGHEAVEELVEAFEVALADGDAAANQEMFEVSPVAAVVRVVFSTDVDRAGLKIARQHAELLAEADDRLDPLVARGLRLAHLDVGVGELDVPKDLIRSDLGLHRAGHGDTPNGSMDLRMSDAAQGERQA
jgi:hypothetical protein